MNELENKRFMRLYVYGMAAYVVTLFVWVFIVIQLGPSIWSYLGVLLPVGALVYAMVNLMQAVRQQDELERKIQLESVLITSFVTGSFAVFWGLLEFASLVPHFPTFLFGPGAIGVWGIVSTLIRRQYQ